MSDTFRILTGSGSSGISFDRKRFSEDVGIFNPRAASASSQPASAAGSSSSEKAATGASVQLPSSLDFFGSARRGKGADGEDLRGQKKRRRLQGAGDEARKSEEDEDSHTTESEPLTRSTAGAFLKEKRLKLTGTDAPLPLTAWSEIKSRWNGPSWLSAAPSTCGFATPTPIQCAATSILLDDRDILAGAPTGSGKTLAYLIPILFHLREHKKEGFRALIVAPSRELAVQIDGQLAKLAGRNEIRTCVLTKANQANLKDKEAAKKFDVLITTPLRLVHGLDAGEIDLTNVRHLVLDEADRLLEDGFLEQTDTILAACSHPSLRKALFSATLPSGVEEMAKSFQLDAIRVIAGVKDAATESISQQLTYVGSEEGKLHAVRSMIHEGKLKPPVLLFVQSIERARQLFEELIYDGLHVDVIHGERPKAQRDSVIDAFKRGDVWVLICTELLARGIDFKGVRLVINYDFPQSVQSYVHRIGRTGRAGRTGEAVTFFTKEDGPYLRSVANIMKASGCEVPEWMLKLKKPSQNQRKQINKRPVDRQAVKSAAGSSQGRRIANKRSQMIEASKARQQQHDAGSEEVE
ncbi:P-loop containing nucleoside triphosphate hydrolase protein [Ceraceosorus guamensis]|uniref:RNA helicase n=1 Tax=Ceraceosorus guamensis TaxID=1522189 RepID=A0A316W7L5_9BASI|nr:P-loop containing nucleoside triphosphate hydrolase protein [Ceraceosorus guamensis]PWN45916.1 P-loop containing nucleoside triphosphate hydrolase protein [Ceraceosorus guamensis]